MSRERMRALAIALLLGGALACVATLGPPRETARHRTQAVEDAGGFVGAEACSDCHGSFEGHFMSNAYHADCERCHGPAERHAWSARAQDIRYPSSSDCATCHEGGQRTLHGWDASEHARAGVICTDCHDTHNREPQNIRRATDMEVTILRQAGSTTQLCSSCHAEVVASLNLPSHHPIAEGMLGCTDCHTPHASRRESLGDRTSDCTGCHEEQAGPFIYEHAPVAEDCGYCHTPHGASADPLLESNQPAACISCHTVAEAGAVHDPWAFITRCTDCHGAVHGSYSDPHLRR